VREDEEQWAIPKECAVKVFKTSLNEFKSRDKYIKEDMRYLVSAIWEGAT
jgi:RIO kinase 3